MKNLRRISQGLFALTFLFLFLQTESKGADDLGYPVKIFLDFDPLISITTLFSSHTFQAGFYFSISVIFITLVCGRVFCGWVCPLGTLNNIFSALKKKKDSFHSLNWFRAKYYILIFLLISSVFSLQLAGIMDPISLLIRSFSVSIYPMFNISVSSLFNSIYNDGPDGLVEVSEAIYTILRDNVMAFNQPYYLQSAFIGLLFLMIMGLNLYERRFWCRYLCPLGAMLGLLSRYSLLKRSVSEGCNECGSCASVCQSNSQPDKPGEWRPTECLYCWNCDDICPQNAVSFGFEKNDDVASLDLQRRRVMASAVTGIIAVPLLRTAPLAKPINLSPELIRPPGSLAEDEFLKRCVKCGECMKVCITNGLQPTFLEAGLEGIWSPMLVPRIGYCEFRCTLCGQVCPTGAIEELPIEKKTKVKIGLAMIDKNRCLPHAHATPCIVCEEVCPTPKKAIWFNQVEVLDREGQAKILQQPVVDLDLCIGCGICETKCPVVGKPAIYVTNAGESRSEENQLLL